MEAYLHGVSTRKVDDLVKALGADTGISKSEVSRICADLDEEVGAFRDRSLAEVAYPYVFLDATYCKARVNRRVVSQAVVIATGVTADGRREVLGLRRRRQRGRGVLDRVPALPEGPRTRRGAAGHQRCPHRAEVRDRLGAASAPPGNAAGSTSCATCSRSSRRATRRWSPPRSAPSSPSPTPSTSHEQFEVIATMLGKQLPKVEAMLREAHDDLLAFTGFPVVALEEDLVDQPARAAQQGSQTPHRRRRRLPQPRRPAPPGRRGPGRGPRRMAGHRRTPLPLRTLHGPARQEDRPRRWPSPNS